MSETLRRVQQLASAGDVKISSHGYDELAEDGILARDVVNGTHGAIVVEDYPNYPKGPCVLVLLHGSEGEAIHALWGIPRGKTGPAVLITAYRPDPEKWGAEFTRRRTR